MSQHDSTHLISRRRALGLLGSTGGGLLIAGTQGAFGNAFANTREGDDYVANAAKACMLTAEQEEGPFYVAVDDVRSNIVVGQVGLPFELEMTIINSVTCKPLVNAAVDIWHCNGSGVYSDIASEDTTGQTYLRGVQFTNKQGQVTFTSIFPGHYSGRTTHVHARIHIGSSDAKGTLTGGHIAHTGQMFPPDAVNTEVYKLAPYKSETATVVPHASDRVWTDQHGSEGLMKITQLGSRLSKGLKGTVTLAVNPKSTPALIGATSGGTGGLPTGGLPTGTPPYGIKP